MTWTKQAPTVPGHYWRRVTTPAGTKHVYMTKITTACIGSKYLEEPHLEWSGPIPEPEERSEA